MSAGSRCPAAKELLLCTPGSCMDENSLEGQPQVLMS